MPHHVIVDGSNLATEGRSAPSLKQLNEAVLAYMAEHPTALITVVVDATFGHRIDAKEVPEFDEAMANNEIVAPPAGAIGRGDAFVLGIANKVNATILSNDSYQEFHGDYPWLFDEGRLVGGKPVPHIGWVFVNRLPVRGPTSRKSVQDSKRKGERRPTKAAAVKASPEANAPMPVPTAPPPGARLPRGGREKPEATGRQVAPVAARSQPESRPAPRSVGVNDLLTFLTFVEHHPPGTSVNAVVESYSSHGAYVSIGDVKGYVPLSLMADPPPRSAREFMKIGESLTLVVESFVAARRSIDLAVPTVASVRLPTEAPKKRTTKKAAAQPVAEATPEAAVQPPKRVRKAAVPKVATAAVDTVKASPAKAATAKAGTPKASQVKASPVAVDSVDTTTTVVPAKRAKKAPAAPAAGKAQPTPAAKTARTAVPAASPKQPRAKKAAPTPTPAPAEASSNPAGRRRSSVT